MKTVNVGIIYRIYTVVDVPTPYFFHLRPWTQLEHWTGVLVVVRVVFDIYHETKLFQWRLTALYGRHHRRPQR